ncbi:ead/Ea22-like family protein [Salmonella enterica subsp. enterica serovar Glostrup]|nr:ead/Ea22-like family protein [Salmonella enterica subsp. enterica serovar Glostrup]
MTIDKQALRARAEKATCGEWSLEYGESRFDDDDALIHREVAGYIPICRIEGAHPESGFDEDFQMEQQANAEFISAANPATVLALLDENLQLQREKDATEAVALALRDDMRQAREQLAAAERRIAELEAREVNLSKLSVGEVMHMSGFSRDYAEGWCAGNDNAMHEIRAAGIGVKQQEDSVDSDVGRNQPGMVVAVHIGTGDFVKVKGQVFEVEETDFDDHDVTLWFVGGNTLKCAAGCQVEVVSAPVAAGIKVKGE